MNQGNLRDPTHRASVKIYLDGFFFRLKEVKGFLMDIKYYSIGNLNHFLTVIQQGLH